MNETAERIREQFFKDLNLIMNDELDIESDEDAFVRHLIRKHKGEIVWELVEYECIEGKCLMIRNIPNDSKLGALSLDHQDIGEAIVEELNKQQAMIIERDQEIETLKFQVSALKYALREIREIEVEIDVEGEIDD